MPFTPTPQRFRTGDLLPQKAGDLGSGFQYFIVPIDSQKAIAAKNGGGLTQNTLQLYGQSGVQLDWPDSTSSSNPTARTLSRPQMALLDRRQWWWTRLRHDADRQHPYRCHRSPGLEQFTFVDRGDSTYCIQTVSVLSQHVRAARRVFYRHKRYQLRHEVLVIPPTSSNS